MSEQWSARPDLGRDSAGLWEVVIINHEGGYRRIAYGLTEDRARLIAAAPDLLAELKHCVWLLSDLQAEPGLITKQARAAIAKALGPMTSTVPKAPSPGAMAAFGASHAACYKWPEDTELHRACRAAYCEGAHDVVGPMTSTSTENQNDH